MAPQTSGDTSVNERFVRLDDGDMYVVEDGPPGAPVLLLLHNAAVPASCWNPIIPALSRTHRVIRVDLLGGGRSSRPIAGGYDIPTQARRVAAALAELGVPRATVIGHSSGCTVATALAEQRPEAISALALIDMGPGPEAKIPEPRLVRIMLTRFPGRLLWSLRTEASLRRGARTSVSRPVDIPDAFVESLLTTSHHAFVQALRGPVNYLAQQSLPERLAPLGLPVLVIFGSDDRRWRPSSAEAYRVVPGARVEVLPGVGHTPMLEDPDATGTLLLEFAASVERVEPQP